MRAGRRRKKDATAVKHLKDAGAVLVGALNMDEYAYGFSTEKRIMVRRVTHTIRNASPAALRVGRPRPSLPVMVPLTLGSDTNGSIRVPAAFAGSSGSRPLTAGFSRAGAVFFAESFDHVGPFARSVRDLAAGLRGFERSGSRVRYAVTGLRNRP